MAALGLALLLLYALLAFGVRMAVQLHRTGSSGLAALRGLTSRSERFAGLLFALASLLCLAGPILELSGAISPLGPLSGEAAEILGVLLATTGISITLAAQLAMGDSWRIGVDPSERTQLVTDGPFALVRNPIFTGMIPAFAGIALLAPDVVTIAGALLLAVALELHTRAIEEPYLASVHGQRYTAYAGRVGRFLPGIGRLRSQQR
jgi:protein-S-isoprenylcysteine O-methyltransferase Ste14